MIKEISFYFKIWLSFAQKSFAKSFYNRVSSILFLIGKIVRGIVAFTFFFSIFSRLTVNVSGYGLKEIILYFLIYNILVSLSDFLFREVYEFRAKVVSGDLDLVLTKPISPLFNCLLTGADPLDLLIVLLLIIAMIVFLLLNFSVSLSMFLLFIICFVLAMLIQTAFYISVMAFGIIFLEVDHIIGIYRDIQFLAEVPIRFYKSFFQFVLTYIVPVGIAVAVPVEVLIGLFNLKNILVFSFVSLFYFMLSLYFWNYALKKYSSASS
ncbi:MAG: multidrug ABC transporter permease [Patescibacteria group bacterium]|nr:MAG: multidrug ABC transporter permease [Patescibacteria group bacterium]